MQRSSAVGAIDIIGANHALALGTTRAQFGVATRAEVESRVDWVAALWAGTLEWAPENEEEEDAEGVGNENGHDGPEYGAHAAAFGVAVDVADEEQIEGSANAGQ